MPRRRAPSGKRTPPKPIQDVLSSVLSESGIAARVDQAGVIPEWASLVGAPIAAVTSPKWITATGTLFVEVTTNAWMTELSLLEPELLRSLNAKAGRAPIRRIRWVLAR